MEDQVSFLKSLGLSAIALHDKQSKAVLKGVEKGHFAYVFTLPEMLNANRWCKPLSSEGRCRFLVVITIDDEHCISRWGSSKPSNQTAMPFKRWYGNPGELRLLTCKLPSIVLTATACSATRREIFNPLTPVPAAQNHPLNACAGQNQLQKACVDKGSFPSSARSFWFSYCSLANKDK